MIRRRPLPLRLATCALLVAACDHSPPTGPYASPQRVPWHAGPPEILTPHPVLLHGFTDDGQALLFARRDIPRVGGPSLRYRPDSMEQFVGMIATSGGTPFWEYSDNAAGQEDSLNNITTVALSPSGRLLFQQATGNLTIPFPVTWHVELYVLDTLRPAVKRRLLTLYRDNVGVPTVPHGTINWLSDLRWLGDDHFVAAGFHRVPNPDAALVPVGLVVGRLGADSASIQRLATVTSFDHIAITPGGHLLVADGLALRVVDPLADTPLASANLPAVEQRALVAIGCNQTGCTAVTRDGEEWQWRLWQVNATTADATMLRTLGIPALGTLRLSPAGSDAIIETESGVMALRGFSAP